MLVLRIEELSVKLRIRIEDFLFSSSISSISAPLVVTYVEERFGTL